MKPNAIQRFLWTAALLALGAAPLPAQKPATDLDALMEQALKRRDAGRDVVRDYILDEVERAEALGPGRIPLYRIKREYQWYLRDGVHVRSPIRFDGVELGDEERRKHEDAWIEEERGRKGARGRRGARGSEPDPAPPDPAKPGLTTPIPEPRFVSDAYFLTFSFKPGNYFLAGREKLDGRDVLRIEYYPDVKESGASEKKNPDSRGGAGAKDAAIERHFEKTSLVTLWVDPAEKQILKLQFENIWLDFLPASWLVQVTGITASMTMMEPFKGVWLPRNMSVHADLTLASGNFELNYAREFSGYKRAEVTTETQLPGAERQ
jgi:hypothetical protein